jgi:hypothetical protein
VLLTTKEASDNGNYVENLISGHKSNHNNLIDCIELKIEIKSCLEKHKKWRKYPKNPSTCYGSYKLHIEQHKELLKIDGYYLFVVISREKEILRIKKVKASEIEKYIELCIRKLTKHGYYSVNWRLCFNLQGIEMASI